MVEALVYMADNRHEDEIRDLFRDAEFRITITQNISEAVRYCAGEWVDLVFIWLAEYEQTKAFVAALRESKLNFLPCVALINNKDELREIISLDITDYILLPLPREEFYLIVRHIIHEVDFPSAVMQGMNWQGSLEEYNLLDLIQMIDKSQKDAELEFSYKDYGATLYFKEGKLIHASLSNFCGEPVLHKLIFWSKGNFQIRFSENISVNQTIQSNNQEILLTVVHDLSEWDRAYQGMPDLYETQVQLWRKLHTGNDVITNLLIESNDISSFQKDILKRCGNPVPLFDLFLCLVEDNQMIIQELKFLLQKGLLVKANEIESLVEEERQQTGMTKFLRTFSSVFKKGHDIGEIQRTDEPLSIKDEIARIEFRHVNLKAQDKDKIIQKINTLS